MARNKKKQQEGYRIEKEDLDTIIEALEHSMIDSIDALPDGFSPNIGQIGDILEYSRRINRFASTLYIFRKLRDMTV